MIRKIITSLLSHIKEYSFIGSLILAILLMVVGGIVGYVGGAENNNKCKAAGGIYINENICIKPEALINLKETK